MTKVVIKRTNDGDFAGFKCEGHADYRPRGEDIICAALSVLTINTINSLEVLAKEPMTVEKNEENGHIAVTFTQKTSAEARLLMESYVLGLSEIFNHYGKKYLRLEFERD
ncbi:MAG: ribosomal-processing cysteine protease Prp [Lachnospiraceae bacterium]|jgi:uncharacterized protein YsxB (DUF464 family)|nr:ribosomal-processing cysteine protease Prp [Lachnospiraceae bacterium]